MLLFFLTFSNTFQSISNFAGGSCTFFTGILRGDRGQLLFLPPYHIIPTCWSFLVCQHFRGKYEEYNSNYIPSSCRESVQPASQDRIATTCGTPGQQSDYNAPITNSHHHHYRRPLRCCFKDAAFERCIIGRSINYLARFERLFFLSKIDEYLLT